MLYNVRFVHKIAPRDTDTMQADLAGNLATMTNRELGAVLRSAGVLYKGAAVSSMRPVAGGVAVFLNRAGHWHSIVITAD